MPRPCKRRRICGKPECIRFGPLSEEKQAGSEIVMTLDEYECIRLIDLNGLTQEECGQQMGVARATVQAIYSSARRKMAQCLVEQMTLDIRGGNYVVCGRNCRKENCGRCRDHCQKEMEQEAGKNERKVKEDENSSNI